MSTTNDNTELIEKTEKSIEEIKKEEARLKAVEKLKKLDLEAERIKNNQTDLVKFNISGEHFATRIDTLLNIKDSLFYKIVLTKKFDLTKEIFIDRNNTFFGDILDYLRKGSIDFSKYSKADLESIKEELDYYELVDVVSTIDEKLKEPVFTNFTFSGAYVTSGITVGSNKLEDISDRNLATGICAISPGFIMFELNHEFDICGLEVGGYTGNTTYWASSNGSGASILISKDNITWSSVSTIPSNYSSTITQVSFAKTPGKYIKFQHNSYLGLGYCRVIKE